MDSAGKNTIIALSRLFVWKSAYLIWLYYSKQIKTIAKVAIDLKLSQFQMIKRLTCKFMTKYT